jgi:hypothetical protein
MLKKILASIAILAISIISLDFILSQAYQDDPNLDQIPKHLRGLSSPKSNMAVITTPDGFDNFNLGVDFAEPHISMNPKNVLQNFCAFNTNGTHYTMNGLDWFVNNPSLPNPLGDPVTAYDSLGNLYYENMTGTSSVIGCYIVKSTNNGQTWQTPIFGISGNDKNWIAADQTSGPYANYVYTTITPGTFARSTDYGASWNTVYNFSTQNLPGMMVCVGPNVIGGNISGGCVYVVTNYGSTFSPAYYFYVSTNGGTAFTMKSAQNFAYYVGTAVGGRHSVENMRTRPYPFITADNSFGTYRGRLYLVYANNTPVVNGAKPDIWCRYSTDQGASWSSEVQVNDDANTTANHQWHPSIWCDKTTGRLYIKWLDTRNCPTSDSCEVYATYSDNGGVSFMPNQKINSAKFRINCTTCGGGGTPAYLGDYDAVTSNAKTSMICWTDFRAGNFGSYVAYFPDFGLLASPSSLSIPGGGNGTVTAKVPAVKLYNDKVKFTYTLDSLPTSGTITITFQNGKDSITAFPDSVKLNISASANVNARVYKLTIKGAGSNGTPVHTRNVNLLVNMSNLNIGTNREGQCTYQVNGVSYTTRQNLAFPTNSVVNVKAISPYTMGGTQYMYQSWSDNGDTAHNVTMSGNLTLTANYKIQYKLTVISSYGTTSGGNIFYDSAAPAAFSVSTRRINVGGTMYYFHGWTGIGVGAYTSPDSTGIDSAATVYMTTNPVVEQARWNTTSGITILGNEIPKEFKLRDNYPNPFNPSTKIKFDIPRNTLVKLIVYDVLGREVETIINSNMQAGYYELNWNAAYLAGGVYFYRLETDSFTDTKRMVYIK